MVRRLALVKSREEAFNIGLQAELIDETNNQSSKFDSFILTEPGIPAVKIEAGHVLENVMVVFHRYSNLQGIKLD